jgi:hypothetical protein
MFTVRTCSCAKQLEQEQITGGLALVVAFWYERNHVKNSRFAPYFNWLPESEDVPSLWTQSDLAQLQGTQAHACVLSDSDSLRLDFEEIALPFFLKLTKRKRLSNQEHEQQRLAFARGIARACSRVSLTFLFSWQHHCKSCIFRGR